MTTNNQTNEQPIERAELIRQLREWVALADVLEQGADAYESHGEQKPAEKPADDDTPQPLLVRDLAEILGKSALDVCAVITDLGFTPQRSVNMALDPTEAIAIAKHFSTTTMKPLTEARVRNMCTIGAIYAPDGVVTRQPNEYRREIEDARVWGFRMAEAAHNIKEES